VVGRFVDLFAGEPRVKRDVREVLDAF